MPEKQTRPTRRRVLQIGFGAAAVAAVGGVVDAMIVEPKWIDVSRTDVAIRDLPPAWEGATVAVLADTHFGPLVELEYADEIAAILAREDPDVLAIVGDLVSRSRVLTDDLRDRLAAFGAKQLRCAVLGNHDYSFGADAVSKILSNAGFTVLMNAAVQPKRDGRALCFAGVEDLWRGRPDAEAALSGVGPDTPRVLLCHNPDYADRLPTDIRVDLMLSGHTHGGQVNLPLLGRLKLPVRNRRYTSGLALGPRCPVYTSRGLGMVGMAIRFNCRPELPILTLRRA